MKSKTRFYLLSTACWGLALVLYPLGLILSDKLDNTQFLYALFAIEIALILFPAKYSKQTTEQAVLPDDYVPSNLPVLEIRNRPNWRQILLSEAEFLLFIFVFATVDYVRHDKFDWFLTLFLIIVSIPILIISLRSIMRSSYTFRSDHLLIKEYRVGRLITDLDIPIDQIHGLRYKYSIGSILNHLLELEVNGNKLTLWTSGCAEQLAHEILSRQRKLEINN